MNILLTLRLEITCLGILVFLLIYSTTYCRNENKQYFTRICAWGLLHVILDAVTVFTVNHLDTVPEWLNFGLHALFYVFAILFCYDFFRYVVYISCPGDLAKKLSRIMFLLPLAYFCLIPFLRVDYVIGRGTNYSFGPCVFMGYGCAALLCLLSAGVILINFKKIERNAGIALVPMVFCMMVGLVAQIVVPELLFTGADITLVTVGMYFAVENPAERYRERAYIDAATSLKNKNCYEEEVEFLDGKYRSGFAKKPVGCVVCDLNGLKFINDQYGHLTGDDMLRLSADVLAKDLESAYNVYRLGGDEFVALYTENAVEIMEREVERARRDSEKTVNKDGLRLSISMGCAVTGENESISDAVAAADKKMYEEKARMKKEVRM